MFFGNLRSVAQKMKKKDFYKNFKFLIKLTLKNFRSISLCQNLLQKLKYPKD